MGPLPALFRLTAAVLVAQGLCAAGAHAQAFPAKPVRMIVPFPAGGGLDTTARAFGLKLNEYWGQSVIIENRPGASGMIGAEVVVRAPKDGYLLLVCSPAEVALNPALYAKMPYDAFKDLAPISLAATYPNIIVVHASLPVKTVKELIALSKRTAGGLPFGSSGTGSTQHLAGEWLNRNAGFNLLHVPYKGAAPATTDLVGGQIPTAILGLAPVIPHIKSGRLHGIAVTAAQRAAAIPDVPTMNESGVKFESTQWFGFLAPAGTPADVIAKIQADVKRAAADPGIRDRLAPLGGDPLANTPEEFGAFIRAENAKYAKVIKDAGIKAE
ncbi:MAG: Bug family tripartite tricarboxylate transporter substrate binding protein [Burkholderiales bacterium]